MVLEKLRKGQAPSEETIMEARPLATVDGIIVVKGCNIAKKRVWELMKLRVKERPNKWGCRVCVVVDLD